MKKILGICITLIILSFSFAACSSKSNDGKVTEPTGNTAAASDTTSVAGDLGEVLSTGVSELASDVFDMTTTR